MQQITAYRGAERGEDEEKKAEGEGGRGRRVFAYSPVLDFRDASLISRKSSCGVRSTLRPLPLNRQHKKELPGETPEAP